MTTTNPAAAGPNTHSLAANRKFAGGWLALILAISAAGAATATTVAKLATAFYQPLVGDRLCLSPDGRRIAYTQHEKGRAWVRVTDVDPPHAKKAWPLAVDEPAAFRNGAVVPAAITFLEWAADDRLVVQTDSADIYTIEVGSELVRKIVDENLVSATLMLDASLLLEQGGHRNPSDREAIDFSPRLARELARVTDDTRVRQAVGRDNAELSATLAATAAIRDAIVDYAETIEGAKDGEGRLDTERAKQEMERAHDIPRIPWALGLLGDREHLVVGAIGAPPRVSHALYRVNVVTGKLAVMEEHDVSGPMLCDSQGRPAFVYASEGRRDTRSFLYRPAGQKSSRWIPLGGAAAREFAVTGANYHGERSMVLALDAGPSRALVASNVGRENFAIFTLNLATGERTGPIVEDARHDLVDLDPRFPHPAVVIDPVGRRVVGIRQDGAPTRARWFDPQLAVVQKLLEDRFPGRTVELLGWNDGRTRFMTRVSSGADPGRIFVYQPNDQLCFEMLRRAPMLRRSDLAPAKAFAGTAPSGSPVSGTLVLPPAPRINPPPLLIFLRDDLLQRPPSGFDRELQLFAAMGFVAARVDYRGSAGRGRQYLGAIQAGFDRVPLEDVLGALEAIGREHVFDRRRVAIAGEGFGGYVALRALQLHPSVFRCAVSIDGPLDLRRWTRSTASQTQAEEIVNPEITGGRSGAAGFVALPAAPVDFFAEVRRKFIAASAVPLAEISVLRELESITKPVFLAVNPRNPQADVGDVRALRTSLQRLKRPVEYVEIGDDFGRGAPDARAGVFRRIEEFFNLHVYDYKVNVGEAKEAK